MREPRTLSPMYYTKEDQIQFNFNSILYCINNRHVIWKNGLHLRYTLLEMIRGKGTNFSEILIKIHASFNQLNAYENIICKMATIFARPQCVTWYNIKHNRERIDLFLMGKSISLWTINGITRLGSMGCKQEWLNMMGGTSLFRHFR